MASQKAKRHSFFHFYNPINAKVTQERGLATISDGSIESPGNAIHLAISTEFVAEDGTTNLIYTFSRTGPTTSALTVNYTVAGTASIGTDYTDIAATPATKSITFAAGSATATVTVDPTADASIEPDETVAITLASGTGYTIATTIDGLAGSDTLTGLAGVERFAFRFSHSSITAPDRVTVFAFNSDKISLLSSTGSPLPIPSAFSRAADNPSPPTPPPWCAPPTPPLPAPIS
jgi:hypothetical protein